MKEECGWLSIVAVLVLNMPLASAAEEEEGEEEEMMLDSCYVLK